MHAHMHIYSHTYIHLYELQMATDMEASMFSMFSMHVGVWMHVCACLCVHSAWDTPTYPHPPSPQSTQLPHLQGGTPRISQNSIALELIKIIQFCLKI